MELPLDPEGFPDVEAMEYLLTVHELLELMYLLSSPNKSKPAPGLKNKALNLPYRRSLKRLLDWGLVTIEPSPLPDRPLRHLLRLTPNGEYLASNYSQQAEHFRFLRNEYLEEQARH